MLGQLGELCLYKMWTMYHVAGVNARPKNSVSLAPCSLFFSAVSSPGSSFSCWNLLSIYLINLSPFSSTRVSHCLQVGHPQTTAHIKRTPMKWRLRPGSRGMAWTRILFLSVGMDVMMKVSCFASRGSGYWAEVGRLIKPSFHNWISLFLYCSALMKLSGTPWKFVWPEFVSAVLVRTFFPLLTLLSEAWVMCSPFYDAMGLMSQCWGRVLLPPL